MCTCRCYIHVCANCLQRSEVNVGCLSFFPTLFTYFWDRVFHWTQSSLIGKTPWPLNSGGPLISAFQCWTIGTHCHAWLSTWVLRIWTGSSCLGGEHLIHWAIFQPQSTNYKLQYWAGQWDLIPLSPALFGTQIILWSRVSMLYTYYLRAIHWVALSVTRCPSIAISVSKKPFFYLTRPKSTKGGR